MSAKKKNKKRHQQPANPSLSKTTAEKLVQQLNSDDEAAESSNSGKILAEYEQKALEAEKRMADRLRQSEQNEQMSASAPKEPPVPANVPADKATDTDENDVKQFVPHSSAENMNERHSASFSQALSEDQSELSVEETDITDEASAESDSQPERPNKFYLVFAVFVIIMSVIGIISTVNFGVGVVSDIANRTELKNELALFLYPVVAVDPPDCDSVDELPPSIIIESAIWRIILTGDNSNYEKLYNTYMYVPAIDVEFSVRSIFGNSVEIQHQTVGTMDITFTYIEDMNSYQVPINPHYAAYSPRITDVSNIGELYTVTVEYIPPSALSVEGIEFEVEAQKTMVYTLSKSKNVSTLHSIKNITRIGNSYAY